MAGAESFKRGQLVWALWQAFSRHASIDPRRAEVPSAFATRVRKMGEFDVPLSPDERPGKGTHIEYSAYHAFELGVALTLQDTGLKQAEVAFLVRNVRAALQEQYSLILDNAPAGRGPVDHAQRPRSPRRMVVSDGATKLANNSRAVLADTSVFMTFRYVEIVEAWNRRPPPATATWKGAGDPPLIVQTKFHRGLESLSAEMDRLATDPRGGVRIVVELSHLAVRVTEALKLAPMTRRGPESKANGAGE